MDGARPRPLRVAPSPAVWGSLLLPPSLGGFLRLSGWVAFSNPSFHLAQTGGLSQAGFPGIRLGGFDPVFGLDPGTPLRSLLRALLTMPFPSLPGAGLGLTSRSELVA